MMATPPTQVLAEDDNRETRVICASSVTRSTRSSGRRACTERGNHHEPRSLSTRAGRRLWGTVSDSEKRNSTTSSIWSISPRRASRSRQPIFAPRSGRFHRNGDARSARAASRSCRVQCPRAAHERHDRYVRWHEHETRRRTCAWRSLIPLSLRLRSWWTVRWYGRRRRRRGGGGA